MSLEVSVIPRIWTTPRHFDVNINRGGGAEGKSVAPQAESWVFKSQPFQDKLNLK